MRAETQQLGLTTAKKLTYSAIWWKQMYIASPTLHYPNPHDDIGKTTSFSISSKSFFETSVNRNQKMPPCNNTQPGYGIIWLLTGIWVLPRHRTRTSDCPSCGDTWAWRQVHWGGIHPNKGRLSLFLYPPCKRTPEKQEASVRRGRINVITRLSRNVYDHCVFDQGIFEWFAQHLWFYLDLELLLGQTWFRLCTVQKECSFSDVYSCSVLCSVVIQNSP